MKQNRKMESLKGHDIKWTHRTHSSWTGRPHGCMLTHGLTRLSADLFIRVRFMSPFYESGLWLVGVLPACQKYSVHCWHHIIEVRCILSRISQLYASILCVRFMSLFYASVLWLVGVLPVCQKYSVHCWHHIIDVRLHLIQDKLGVLGVYFILGSI